MNTRLSIYANRYLALVINGTYINAATIYGQEWNGKLQREVFRQGANNDRIRVQKDPGIWIGSQARLSNLLLLCEGFGL